MGVAKSLDYSDLVLDAVGTASAVASGAAKQVVQTATNLATSGALSGAVRFGVSAVARVNPYLALGMGAYDAYQYLTQEEKAQLSIPERVAVENSENMARTLGLTQEKSRELGEQTKAINDSVVYEQGQTLPSVLSQNAKALTQSINTLTSTVNEQFGLLNNYMMALAIYQQQFLDLKVSDVNLKAESVTALNALPVSLFQLVEAIQGIGAIPSVDGITTPLSKISESIKEISEVSLESVSSAIKGIDGVSAPLSRVVEAIQGLGSTSLVQLVQAVQGIGAIPSTDGIVEAVKGIGSVSLSIDELAKLKAVDNEQVKEHYALREGEIALNKESMEYAKTSQTVKDLDGQVVASFAPREAELVKNATLAKDTTDKINFELPPEFDADLSLDKLDISGILGYDDGSDIYKEFFTRMGGVGL